jgi:hypothetical protein
MALNASEKFSTRPASRYLVIFGYTIAREPLKAAGAGDGVIFNMVWLDHTVENQMGARIFNFQKVTMHR